MISSDLFQQGGQGCKIRRPFIIAEAGVNHEGKLVLAKRLIDESAEGGADAIKFQTYRAGTIACTNSPSYWDLSKEPTRSQYELFQKYDSLWKGEFEILKEEDKDQVRSKYESSKTEIKELINTFYKKGYRHGASYLEKLSGQLFANIEIWLETGVIAPKTTSLLERAFREIGRRLKRIAWGWSDTAVTNISKMIMIRQYSRDKWEQYWKEKLGIKGYFSIQISEVF